MSYVETALNLREIVDQGQCPVTEVHSGLFRTKIIILEQVIFKITIDHFHDFQARRGVFQVKIDTSKTVTDNLVGKIDGRLARKDVRVIMNKIFQDRVIDFLVRIDGFEVMTRDSKIVDIAEIGLENLTEVARWREILAEITSSTAVMIDLHIKTEINIILKETTIEADPQSAEIMATDKLLTTNDRVRTTGLTIILDKKKLSIMRIL